MLREDSNFELELKVCGFKLLRLRLPVPPAVPLQWSLCQLSDLRLRKNGGLRFFSGHVQLELEVTTSVIQVTVS
jgi:hypothetical protein